jgi:hypothetical protein
MALPIGGPATLYKALGPCGLKDEMARILDKIHRFEPEPA